MGFWGGGAGAGGWSSGLGGQGHGPVRVRNADGWDDEELGKVYDAEVVRRLIPYLAEYKWRALLAFACMVTFATTSFLLPVVAAFAVKAGVEHNTDQVWLLLGVMVVLTLVSWGAQYLQQVTTAWIGNRLLMKLRTQMYDHMQGLSLSFYDEMEV